MFPDNDKRKGAVISLAVLVVILAAICGKLGWDRAALSLRLSFAEDQIRIFEEMRMNALKTNPSEAVENLRYVVNYYPSGSKQIAGSQLDNIVEIARTNAAARIIDDLRERTDKDYGEDPQRWIDQK